MPRSGSPLIPDAPSLPGHRGGRGWVLGGPPQMPVEARTGALLGVRILGSSSPPQSLQRVSNCNAGHVWCSPRAARDGSGRSRTG